MSGSVPYLGSKISLISKAEIRYEGVLYTIDPKESTVALAKVKSFGTEDRPTDRPVPPRDEIFEYIIFRGRDIKDLHVCAPPQMVGLPQDPAIVQSSEPGVLGGIGGLPNQRSYGSPSYSSGVDLPGYGDPVGRQPPPGLQLPGQLDQDPQAPALSFGSPKGPNAPSAGSAENLPSHLEMNRDQAHGIGANGGGGDQLRENNRLNSIRRPQQQQQQQQRSYPSQGTEYTSRNHAPQGSDYGYRNQSYSQSSANYSRNQGYAMEYSNRNQYGPPRGRGGPRGGRPPRSRGTGGPRGDSGLRFEGEFDFESSNAQFDKEQIEKELKEKLTIGEKGDAGEREASADEEEEAEEEPPIFYDKAKSFFDSISCEALDKSRGGGGRPNWKEERKMNTETFGVPGTSYNRRGGRGRGGRGYYGRGRGGGWNSGYRGGMGYRGQSRNRNQPGSFDQNLSGMTTARS